MSEVLSIYEIADLNKNSITAKDNFSFIYYLDTSSLTKNKVDSLQFLESEFPSRAKRKVTINTILYSTVRPNQEHFGIIENQIADNLIASTGFTTIDIVSSKINAKYLYYKLIQPFVTNYLQGIAENSVSAYPSIKPEAIGNLRFSFPNLLTQQKIASVLSALDDKIELNNRINDNLEQMAKMLYDYWFVQFDFPNENGKPYKSSGGKMVWNKVLKREIPEDWEVKNLFQTTNVQYGFPFSTDYFNEENIGNPVIRIRDILNNSVSNYSNQENIDLKYLIEKGDILVGMDGNFHINYWSKNNCYLNQRVVMIKEKALPNIFTRYQIEPYIQLREKSVSRTTVGHLSDKDLKGINILVPSYDILKNMKPLFGNFLKKTISNQNENQQLSSLRDWLLPMLMNGQVKVE